MGFEASGWNDDGNNEDVDSWRDVRWDNVMMRS
jgi:hypothetical protein